MTAKKYVNAIVGKIQCGADKKQEIRKQLTAEVNAGLRKGESMDEIVRRMGPAKEIAAGYNENMDEQEKKRYRRHRIFAVIIPTVIIVASMAYYMIFQVPRRGDIENSKYFDKAEVENAVMEVVELLDAEDYEGLKAISVDEMGEVLNAETMDDAKEGISKDWGKRKQFGKVYTGELVKGGSHYAVGEMAVTYENISVTYTFSYNQDMELAGLYMK